MMGTPIAISMVVLISMMLSLGDVAFDNLGILIIKTLYNFSIIVLGVEMLNRLNRKELGGFRNE